MRRALTLQVVVTLGVTACAGLLVGGVVASGALSVSEMRSPAQQAEWLRLRDKILARDHVSIAIIDAVSDRPRSVAAVERALRRLPEVTFTWSSETRPRLVLDADATRLRVVTGNNPAGRDSPVDRLFRPGPRTEVVLIGVAPRTEAEFGRRLRLALHGALSPNETATAAGAFPTAFDALERTRADVITTVPLLLLIAVAVPILFFRSLPITLYTVTLAGASTALTLALFRLQGPFSPTALPLIPFIWAVAALDGFHFWTRLAVMGEKSGWTFDLVSRVRRSLYGPCFITSATTAGGMLVLAWSTDAQLMRDFGLYGAFGTMAAYGFTFALGDLYLGQPGQRLPSPGRSRTLRRLSCCAQRHPVLTLAAFAPIIAGGVMILPRIEPGLTFPHIFVDAHPAAREMRHVERRLGLDLAAIEMTLEPQSVAKAQMLSQLNASVQVQHFLEAQPEVRLAISPGLLVRELGRMNPRLRDYVHQLDRRLARGEDVAPLTARELVGLGIADLVESPRTAAEIKAVRSVVFLRPGGVDERLQLVSKIEAFVSESLPGFRNHLHGMAMDDLRAYGVAVPTMKRGILAALALCGLLFLWSLRRISLVVAALVVNVVPLLWCALLVHQLEIRWTIGLIAVPVMILALSVDDTVHLLWPLRGSRSRVLATSGLRQAVCHAGPALLTTTLLLAACFATQIATGMRLSQDMGVLLPSSFLVALAADLTLLPALLRLWGRARGGRTRAGPSSGDL